MYLKCLYELASHNNVTGLPDIIHNPIYATGVGLLVYGQRQRQNQREMVINQPSMKSLWSRMKNWFQGNF